MKYLSKFIILSFVLLFVSHLFYVNSIAATQGIKGTIKNAENNKPLSKVNIKVENSTIGTITNENGQFRLGLSPDQYLLQVSMMGYKPLQVQVHVKPDSMINLNLAMEPTVLQTQAVTVIGQKYRNVVTAPRTETLGLKPAISTVEEEEMTRQGANTIVDAVRYIPGAWIETRGRKVKQFFSVRGQKYPYPEYSINGAWQREFHELPYFFSTSSIEKIEVIRSSAALLTGLTGLGGVVNIVTKQFLNPETVVDVKYGTFQSYDANILHGATRGQVSYTANLSIQNTAGPDRKNAAERMVNGYGRLTWRPRNDLSIDFSLFHLNGKRELAQAVEPAGKKFRTALWEYNPYKATLANVRAFYQPSEHFSSDLLVYYTARNPELVIRDSETHETTSTTSEKDHELGVNYMNAISLSSRNILRFGGLYNHWVAPNGKRFYVGRRTDLQTLSLVCVDEHNFGKFSIDGGVRWSKTYINEYGAFNIGGSPKGFKNVSPITDIWEPAIVNVSLGSNYYLSTLLSLYMNLSNGQIQPRRGSLDIDLEEPETENRTKLDLGIQVDLQKYGQFTMTGFYVNQDNAIVLSGKTRDVDDRILELYLNRDQDQVGVEGDFRFTGFSRHANFFLNAVIMNSRYAEGDEMVENNEIPDVILSGGIYANISRFDFNFFLKYISDYKSTRFVGSVQGQPPAPQPLGDFISINSTLGWSIGPSKNTRLYIDIQNLTDNAYSTVVGYPDFGRQIQFGISHHYR